MFLWIGREYIFWPAFTQGSWFDGGCWSCWNTLFPSLPFLFHTQTTCGSREVLVRGNDQKCPLSVRMFRVGISHGLRGLDTCLPLNFNGNWIPLVSFEDPYSTFTYILAKCWGHLDSQMLHSHPSGHVVYLIKAVQQKTNCSSCSFLDMNEKSIGTSVFPKGDAPLYPC